jgi:hypothetical protein
LREKATEVRSAIKEFRESQPETHPNAIVESTESAHRLKKLLPELIIAAELAISGGVALGADVKPLEAPPPNEVQAQIGVQDPLDKATLEYLKMYSDQFNKLTAEPITTPDAGFTEAPIYLRDLDELDARVRTHVLPDPAMQGYTRISQPHETSDQALREMALEVLNAIQKVRESKPETHHDWIVDSTEQVDRLGTLLFKLILLLDLAISGAKFIRHELPSPEAPERKERQSVADPALLTYLKSFSNRLTNLETARSSRAAGGGLYIICPDSAPSYMDAETSPAGRMIAGGRITIGHLAELDARLETICPPAPAKANIKQPPRASDYFK